MWHEIINLVSQNAWFRERSCARCPHTSSNSFRDNSAVQSDGVHLLHQVSGPFYIYCGLSSWLRVCCCFHRLCVEEWSSHSFSIKICCSPLYRHPCVCFFTLWERSCTCHTRSCRTGKSQFCGTWDWSCCASRICGACSPFCTCSRSRNRSICDWGCAPFQRGI
jgi:hypothetical protein